VGRNGFLGALRRSPDAQGIALHTAPTQKAISTHQMGEYQGPLVLRLRQTIPLYGISPALRLP
jgi:hypothetical protein